MEFEHDSSAEKNVKIYNVSLPFQQTPLGDSFPFSFFNFDSSVVNIMLH